MSKLMWIGLACVTGLFGVAALLWGLDSIVQNWPIAIIGIALITLAAYLWHKAEDTTRVRIRRRLWARLSWARRAVRRAARVTTLFSLGLALTALGTLLFWGFYPGLGEAGVWLGAVMGIAGLLIALYQIVGPFERHEVLHVESEDQDDEIEDDEYEEEHVGDPNQRAFWATLWGWLALEYVIVISVWRLLHADGLSGDELFQDLVKWVLIVSGLVGSLDVAKVSEDPKTIAQLTFMGGRLRWRYKSEGLRHFPGMRLGLFGFIAQNVQTVDHKFGGEDADAPPIEVKTPDNVWTKLSGQWVYEIVDPIRFNNNEGEVGVNGRFYHILSRALRVWGADHQWGPEDWEHLTAMTVPGENTGLRKIMGRRQLPPVPSPLPTEALLEYFDFSEGGTPPPPSKWMAKRWGKKWEGLEAGMPNLGMPEFVTLEREVRKRRKILERVARGDGNLLIPSLGIVLKRLSITHFEPPEDVVKAAMKKAVEAQEKIGQKVQAENILDVATQVKTKFPLMSDQDCMRQARWLIELTGAKEGLWTLDLTSDAKAAVGELLKDPKLAAAAAAAIGAGLGAKGGT